MRYLRKNSTKGYIIFDILIGLFIIGFGFSAVLGLINGAALDRGETDHFLQAVNLAASTMEELLKNLEEDSSYRYVLLTENSDRVGSFERLIKAEWESVDLLLVTVQIRWREREKENDFVVESLFYVPEEKRRNNSDKVNVFSPFDNLGLTLLEVMISLVITGILVVMVLNFYLSQYRLSKQVMAMAELDYALLRAGQVLTSSVRIAEKVHWSNQHLQVTYQQEGKVFNDAYYLADKDLDGIKDLYREHLGVPNPVASGLTSFSCHEIKRGLWKITIKAGNEESEIGWERIVGQKVCL